MHLYKEESGKASLISQHLREAQIQKGTKPSGNLGQGLQAEGTRSVRAWRQECVERVWRRAGRTVWLEKREQGGMDGHQATRLYRALLTGRKTSILSIGAKPLQD